MCTKLARCGNETLGKLNGCSASSGEACPTRVSGLILARELIRGGATSLALLFTSSHGVCSSSVRRNPLGDRILLAISWSGANVFRCANVARIGHVQYQPHSSRRSLKHNHAHLASLSQRLILRRQNHGRCVAVCRYKAAHARPALHLLASGYLEIYGQGLLLVGVCSS
jgi:hypothetical protein